MMMTLRQIVLFQTALFSMFSPFAVIASIGGIILLSLAFILLTEGLGVLLPGLAG